MVKIDVKKHDLYRIREITHNCLDNFSKEERGKGNKVYREMIRRSGMSFKESIFLYTGPYMTKPKIVMEIDIKGDDPYNPKFTVYKKEYYEKAEGLAEKIEEIIKNGLCEGFEIFLTEDYR